MVEKQQAEGQAEEGEGRCIGERNPEKPREQQWPEVLGEVGGVQKEGREVSLHLALDTCAGGVWGGRGGRGADVVFILSGEGSGTGGEAEAGCTVPPGSLDEKERGRCSQVRVVLVLWEFLLLSRDLITSLG